MKAHSTVLTLAISIVFAGAQSSASTLTSAASTKTPEVAPQVTKTAPFSASSPKALHLFPVNDEKGRLLTCIAPEIEKNAETDVFNNCTLAPGRTLDDVMHSFVRTMHYVQRKQEKPSAEPDEKSAQK
jgi:hypothetical protein